MPLDPAEAITLSADVVALVAALRDARPRHAPDHPYGPRPPPSAERRPRSPPPLD